MPYNPSGIFTPPSGTLAEAGTTIRVAQHNPFVNDVSAALSQVLLRSGVAPMTGALAMGSNRITGLANGTAPTDAATVGQVTPYSGFLASVSALALTSDDMVYATGPTAAAKTKVTAFARTLLDDASAAAMRTTLGLGAVATDSVVPVARGGTGGTTQAAARTGLGLGNFATQNTVDINGSFLTGTLSVAGGGTGATSAGAARTNLGLGAVATDNVVPVARGGTGATNAAGARTNIQAPWSPDGGDVRYGQTGNNTALVLPAGGRWEWSGQLVDIGNFASSLQGGVASGGSTVAPAIGGTRSYMYRFWRVA